MGDAEHCGMTYPHHGDIRVCLLPHNHDGRDCETANAAANLEPHPRPDTDTARWVF